MKMNLKTKLFPLLAVAGLTVTTGIAKAATMYGHTNGNLSFLVENNLPFDFTGTIDVNGQLPTSWEHSGNGNIGIGTPGDAIGSWSYSVGKAPGATTGSISIRFGEGGTYITNNTNGLIQYNNIWTATDPGILTDVFATNVTHISGTTGAELRIFGDGVVNPLHTLTTTKLQHTQLTDSAFIAGDTVRFSMVGIASGATVRMSPAITFKAIPIPEPSSTALLGLGTLGLLVRRKR